VSTKKFNEQKALADKYLTESNDCNEKLSKKKLELEELNAKLVMKEISFFLKRQNSLKI
jgi:hypothetical protein